MWIELSEDQKRQCVGVLSLKGQERIHVTTTDGQVLLTAEIVTVDQYNAWKKDARYATYVDGELVPVNHQFKYWQS